jgi:hypothetical protein
MRVFEIRRQQPLRLDDQRIFGANGRFQLGDDAVGHGAKVSVGPWNAQNDIAIALASASYPREPVDQSDTSGTKFWRKLGERRSA